MPGGLTGRAKKCAYNLTWESYAATVMQMGLLTKDDARYDYASLCSMNTYRSRGTPYFVARRLQAKIEKSNSPGTWSKDLVVGNPAHVVVRMNI